MSLAEGNGNQDNPEHPRKNTTLLSRQRKAYGDTPESMTNIPRQSTSPSEGATSQGVSPIIPAQPILVYMSKRSVRVQEQSDLQRASLAVERARWGHLRWVLSGRATASTRQGPCCSPRGVSPEAAAQDGGRSRGGSFLRCEPARTDVHEQASIRTVRAESETPLPCRER